MSVLTVLLIPNGNANPWRKVWEKLMQWDESLTNENRVGRCAQTLLAIRWAEAYEANADPHNWEFYNNEDVVNPTD
jgi:hypothetical protein